MSHKTSNHHIVTGCKENVLNKSLDVSDQALLIALSYHPLLITLDKQLTEQAAILHRATF